MEVDRSQFTIVFEGDISKLPFNPLKMHDTPFGRVVGCGYGNAWVKLMELENGQHDLSLPAPVQEG